MPTKFEFLSSWVMQDRDPEWVIAATQKPAKVIEHFGAFPDGVNHRFVRKDTALMVAALHDRRKTLSELIDNGADLNLQNANGNTALHTAAFFGRLEIATALVEAGADTSIYNAEVSTARDIASKPWTPDVEAKVKNVSDIFSLELRMPEVQERRSAVAHLLTQLGR